METKQGVFIDEIMAYENGELSFDEIIDMFQRMIDDGSVWKFQGHYGRMAVKLIKNGYCHRKE